MRLSTRWNARDGEDNNRFGWRTVDSSSHLPQQRVRGVGGVNAESDIGRLPGHFHAVCGVDREVHCIALSAKRAG
jgi:hypothetical protein